MFSIFHFTILLPSLSFMISIISIPACFLIWPHYLRQYGQYIFTCKCKIVHLCAGLKFKLYSDSLLKTCMQSFFKSYQNESNIKKIVMITC